MTLACQRPLFDLPDDLVYLNCAAQSPCLTESAEAGRRAVSRKWHPWDPERAKVGAEMERCRSLFAGLIGAEARDIAITFTTSYGTAIAAANLSIRPGQSVVLLQDQFPSHYYAWADLARRDGGRLEIVPRPADFDWTAAVLARIGDDTGIAALPNCHWTDGSMLDLEAIGAA